MNIFQQINEKIPELKRIAILSGTILSLTAALKATDYINKDLIEKEIMKEHPGYVIKDISRKPLGGITNLKYNLLKKNPIVYKRTAQDSNGHTIQGTGGTNFFQTMIDIDNDK